MREIEVRAADTFSHAFNAPPTVLVSAPGRVNLIGEHTDYNGGFVLPCAVDRRLAMTAGLGGDTLCSADFSECRPCSGSKDESWADYPRGVVWALREAGHTVPEFRAAFAGTVPIGSGLSSSAAIEAATALGLATMCGLHIERRDLAALCQRAENRFIGVNSGIMDQYASLLGREGAALLVDCRSFESEAVPLDLDAAGLALLVCNTKVKRSLAATGYNDRRAACERAARALGVTALRDATLSDLGRLSGEDLKRARHVVSENERVLQAVEALQRRAFVEFGELMYASHRSLRDDFEVSTPELDTFVEVAIEAGALGARLTGAGFGGCAIAIIEQARLERLEGKCRARYEASGFEQPDFYHLHPASGAEVVG